jgi:hypothetical protein
VPDYPGGLESGLFHFQKCAEMPLVVVVVVGSRWFAVVSSQRVSALAGVARNEKNSARLIVSLQATTADVLPF